MLLFAVDSVDVKNMYREMNVIILFILAQWLHRWLHNLSLRILFHSSFRSLGLIMQLIFVNKRIEHITRKSFVQFGSFSALFLPRPQ